MAYWIAADGKYQVIASSGEPLGAEVEYVFTGIEAEVIIGIRIA